MHYYSKSKYVDFCDCNKKLWCQLHKPEEKEDLNLETIFANGNAVGALAREYFLNTAFVDSPENDLKFMVEKTKEFLLNGEETIAEASFFYENNYCACDLLHRNPDGSFDIYEVKSTTKVVNHYYDDLAYQVYVLTNCGLKIRNTYLMHVNAFYVLRDSFNIQKYFRISDLTLEVKEKVLNVKDVLDTANLILDNENPPQIPITKICEDCAFKSYCYKMAGIQKDSVIYLYNNRNKYNQIASNIHTFADLIANDSKLSTIQKRQINFHYHNLPDHFDVEAVQGFLNQIEFPLYFLDFESLQSPIPKLKGTKPYSQVCFQYSLHILNKENNLAHTEFLGKEGTDFRLSLVEKLLKDLGTTGRILSYNTSFEMTRIKEMAELFPVYREDLLATLDRFLDLATIFQKGYYYNQRMGRSFSIKSVLPALFPLDPSLDYHNLEGVQNGTDAMFQFGILETLPKAEREKIRQQLLQYCALDTYAMVKIYKHLVEKTEKKCIILV